MQRQLQQAQEKLRQQEQKFRSGKSSEPVGDHIEEQIEVQPQPGKADPLTSSADNAAISGGISSSGANAIDHSIDTLQLEQYDYVEEVKLN